MNLLKYKDVTLCERKAGCKIITLFIRLYTILHCYTFTLYMTWENYVCLILNKKYYFVYKVDYNESDKMI